MKTFPDIDHLKATVDQHRPLNPAIVRNLREDLIVCWIYHSNAIKGNTLTLQKTKVALEGITLGGKSIREHLETVNHKNAILLQENLVQKNWFVGVTLNKAAVRTCTIPTSTSTNPPSLWLHRHVHQGGRCIFRPKPRSGSPSIAGGRMTPGLAGRGRMPPGHVNPNPVNPEGVGQCTPRFRLITPPRP